MTATKKKTAGSMTQSRMQASMACPRLEWYKYRAGPAGVGVELTTLQEYFVEGDFTHYALAKWYSTGAEGRPLMLQANMTKRINKMLDGYELTPEEDDRLRTKLAAMIGACQGYRLNYRSDFDKFKILAVETRFETKIGGFAFAGVLDLLVETEDGVGFIDHKTASQITGKEPVTLPVNLQGLMYVLGTKEITGKYPKWYQFNFIKKSALRRKGPTKANPSKPKEPLLEFQNRVQAQYVDESGKMFFRPPPILVQPKVIERILAQTAQNLAEWEQDCAKDPADLTMRLASCTGMYGQPCAFAQACTAFLQGHGEGWDAPECRGFYRPKEVLHPELVEEKNDDD